jgi:AcrR family transcriptional regulator
VDDRPALLEKAAALLALRPDAGMDELAAAAGVSRATFFRRFPSRLALVTELLHTAIDDYIAAVDGAEPERGPAPEALTRVLRAIAATRPSQALLARQPVPEVVEAALFERYAATDERIVALVRRGQDEGAFRVDLPANWVLVVMDWLPVAVADGLKRGLLAPADTERHLVETVLGALRRPGAG